MQCLKHGADGVSNTDLTEVYSLTIQRYGYFSVSSCFRVFGDSDGFASANFAVKKLITHQTLSLTFKRKNPLCVIRLFIGVFCVSDILPKPNLLTIGLSHFIDKLTKLFILICRQYIFLDF